MKTQARTRITAANILTALFMLLALVGFSTAAQAQTVTISGDLYNFQAVNNTGAPVHGFELQIEGALAGDIYYSDVNGRYGAPSIVPYATGVYVRWESTYNSATGQYDESTPVGTTTSFSWQDCYPGGTGYATSGCESFGQSTFPIGTRVLTTTGRWMQDDPANPGHLIGIDPPAAVPFPSWTTPSGTSPTATVEVEAPEPPETPETYGDAQWIKTYTNTLTNSLVETDLYATNTSVVPESASQIEVAWDIIQASPVSNGNGGTNRGKKSNSATLKVDTRSVVKRYELYQYTGVYDAVTHQVVCADTTCTTPGAGELGSFLSGQDVASNVLADSLTVTKTGSGSGTVTGAAGAISCGSKCSVFLNAGSLQTLTAAPASGKFFTGWGGACSGKSLTCTATVNGQTTVTATFQSQHTLTVSKSNSANGTVTATPAGNDKTINCGKTCSAKFTDGTVVTLTATPNAGKTFTNWTNGCTGTAKTCTLTISKDVTAQANFGK